MPGAFSEGGTAPGMASGILGGLGAGVQAFEQGQEERSQLRTEDVQRQLYQQQLEGQKKKEASEQAMSALPYYQAQMQQDPTLRKNAAFIDQFNKMIGPAFGVQFDPAKGIPENVALPSFQDPAAYERMQTQREDTFMRELPNVMTPHMNANGQPVGPMERLQAVRMLAVTTFGPERGEEMYNAVAQNSSLVGEMQNEFTSALQATAAKLFKDKAQGTRALQEGATAVAMIGSRQSLMTSQSNLNNAKTANVQEHTSLLPMEDMIKEGNLMARDRQIAQQEQANNVRNRTSMITGLHDSATQHTSLANMYWNVAVSQDPNITPEQRQQAIQKANEHADAADAASGKADTLAQQPQAPDPSLPSNMQVKSVYDPKVKLYVVRGKNKGKYVFGGKYGTPKSGPMGTYTPDPSDVYEPAP